MIQVSRALSSLARDRRDVVNFISTRVASAQDDEIVGKLLLRAFCEIGALKLPQIPVNEERRMELLNVAVRRKMGVVYVLELGYRLVGTFAFIYPFAPITQAWIEGAANLRVVAVEPEFHGFGFSEVLLRLAEALARTLGIETICLHIQKGADGLGRLYTSFGYERDPRGDGMTNGYEIQGYALHLGSEKQPLLQ